MARLNADTSVMFLIATGRAFHSHAPATEKALSEFCSGARYVELAGVRRSEPAAARNPRILVVVSAM